ncbi:hypothetical protein [Acinetobacter terrae]|uniref:hypothetical protein n=1 Tax=Acinetobacter terrae TaxID=2731247 RepID=UPI0007D852D0|nr:hypothetical protein [Acinetobacter terrae]NNH16343.1 hypothetical protein [Acinetobacter terrae]OAL86331.1 hypothetical protein AY608_13290 [Acinetobacter terrae]
MSFSEEVGQFFALTETQSVQLEAGLVALEQAFQQAESDVVNTPAFSGRFYQKFQQLITAFGIDENNVEAFLDHLYGTERYRQLVTYIVPSYYNAGGDRQVFEELYQEMLSDEQI